jgi:hypothetical protein
MSTEFKNLYINETHSFCCDNGELYISGENFEIVWNTETLFTDLPHIIKMVLNARKETDKRIKKQLEELTILIEE